MRTIVHVCAFLCASAFFATARTATSAEVFSRELHYLSGRDDTQFGYSIDLQDDLAVIGGINRGGSAFLYDVAAGRQLLEFMPSAPGAGFGWGLGIDGNRVIAGQYSDSIPNRSSGSAFIFDASTGAQLHQLKAPSPDSWNHFGSAADISGDIALVGASTTFGGGAAYLFDASTGEYLKRLVASAPKRPDGFGTSVALEGNLAIVGALESAYVFDVATGEQLWALRASDAVPQQLFGNSVSIHGNIAVIGAPSLESGVELGSAYVFDLTSGEQLFKLVADAPAKKFGVDVDVFGDVAIVGASFDSEFGTLAGAAYVFELTTGEQIGKVTANGLLGGEEFGQAVALNGNYAMVGSAASDSAYVFAVCEPSFSPGFLAPVFLLAIMRCRRTFLGPAKS